MKNITRWVLIAALAAAIPSAAVATEGRWQGPDGEWLPFTTDEEVLDFLSTAEVVAKKEIGKGINHFLKVRLRQDGVEAHAIFRSVDRFRARFTTQDHVYLGFHDSDIYECAAYETSRLLGIDNVPPCTTRKIGRAAGTMQLWIEGARDGEELRALGLRAPSSVAWVRQRQTMLLFDGLIYNFDRNQGNLLVDERWKLWFIDHTRSFYKSPEVPDLKEIVWCERGVWERLRALDRATVERHLGEYLGKVQIAMLMKRRDAVVEHLEKRIAVHGEDIVLFDSGLFDSDAGGPAA